MSQQIVNIGTVANDKTGDQVRTAFGKVNDNFTEFYSRLSTGPVRNLFDVTQYGAVSGSDSTVAFTSAINAANAATLAGIASNILIPPGVFTINSALPAFYQNTGVVGSGPFKSFIKVSTAFSGDLFQWSEAWEANFFTTTTVTLPCKTGLMARDFTIVGDRSTSNVQNCFMLYDRVDQVLIENVDMLYMNGQCISAGTLKNSSVGCIRESRFRNLRSWQCGEVGGSAVFSFGATGGLAGTPVYFNNIDIYAPWATGFSINNKNASSAVTIRGYYFDNLRIEGAESDDRDVDLMTIGETDDTAGVATIHIKNAQLISPQADNVALRITSASNSISPSGIVYEGGIFSGGATTGGGVSVDFAKGPISFKCSTFSSGGTALTVAASTAVTGNIFIDACGAESSLTTSVDSTTLSHVFSPQRQVMVGN